MFSIIHFSFTEKKKRKANAFLSISRTKRVFEMWQRQFYSLKCDYGIIQLIQSNQMRDRYHRCCYSNSAIGSYAQLKPQGQWWITISSLVINSMCCIHYPLFKLGTCNTKCEIMFLLEYEGHEDIGRLKQMDPSYKRVDLLNFFLL